MRLNEKGLTRECRRTRQNQHCTYLVPKVRRHWGVPQYQYGEGGRVCTGVGGPPNVSGDQVSFPVSPGTSAADPAHHHHTLGSDQFQNG